MSPVPSIKDRNRICNFNMGQQVILIWHLKTDAKQVKTTNTERQLYPLWAHHSLWAGSITACQCHAFDSWKITCCVEAVRLQRKQACDLISSCILMESVQFTRFINCADCQKTIRTVKRMRFAGNLHERYECVIIYTTTSGSLTYNRWCNRKRNTNTNQMCNSNPRGKMEECIRCTRWPFALHLMLGSLKFQNNH